MCVCFLLAESMKVVKKTDLPVMQTDQDILPSLDDDTDDSQGDDMDDEDDMDDDEDMMADEAAETDEDEYEDEDIDDSEQDDEDTWNNLSTPQVKPIKETTTTSTVAPSTTQSTTELPSTGSSAASLIDPYFTHFDPHVEHQSYKVKVSIRSHTQTFVY